jgi:Asp-tRNA(Asn)/Glu-tRNA(Gln) amidotransferase A subunit family amidase
MSIPSLLAKLRSGELPIADYLDQLEQRFVAIEPIIYSFVPEPRRWERVRREAAEIEAKYPDQGQRPPLFGLPVGVKDIFRVDMLPTRAGSQLPADELYGPESVCVTQLREAGCLILGKTITAEFAYFCPGPTRNPCNPFHTPGGSSSGSAAAVAAGLTPLALGTQTIGSVNRPAAYCGIVGFKPTYNRISKENVIENATSHDHVGIFAQDVAGAEIVAQVLIAAFVPKEPIKLCNLILGIPVGPYLEAAEPMMLEHFYHTAATLEAAGCTIKRIHAMPNFDEICKLHVTVNLREFATYHANFSCFHHLYSPKTRQLLEEGKAISDQELETAQKCKAETRNHLTQLMDKHGLDAWITPGATGPAPAGYESTGNPVMQLPWTCSGLPTLNLKSGTDESGLPLSLQMATRWNGDEVLFAVGKSVETILL